MTEPEPESGSASSETPRTDETPSASETRPSSSRRRRRHRRVRSARRLTLSEIIKTDGLLVLVILGSVLPLGAVHVPVLLAVSVVALLAGVVALLGPGRLRGPVPAAALVLGALALYTALQAVPLPFGLLGRLSPHTADVWARALDPFGDGPPRMASLSLDPGASWVEALKWWSYAAVFVAAAAFGARHGPKWGALLILGASFVVALATIGHGVLNAGKVFGVYTPSMGGRGFAIGPFVNANARAGYLNLGLLAGAGLVASTATPIPRWILAISVATVLGASINTGSRGGLASLLLGLLVLIPLVRQARASEGPLTKIERTTVIAGIALAVGAGAIFAAFAATRTTLHFLEDPSLRKLRIILWAPPMIRDYPVFGVGRGAFEGAFTAYKMGDNNAVYSHPENFLVQWLTEWGIPVSCFLVLGLTWLFRPSAWGAGKSTAGSGLFAGFVALASQNFVDLGLELPGVAVAACAAAGVAFGGHVATDSPAARPLRPLLSSAALALVGIALFVPAAFIGTKTLKTDKDRASRSFPEDPKDHDDAAAFREDLRAAMKRHPAEPYFPRMGALLAMTNHAENPLPWLEHALERAPTSGRTHYLVAFQLGRHGVKLQALLELRYAVEQDQDLSMRAARFAIRLTRHEEELMRLVPDGRDGVLMLSVLAGTLRHIDPDAAYRFLEEAIERDPKGATGARLELTRMLLASLRDRRLGSRCAEERRIVCEKAILEQIRTLSQAMPQEEDPLELAGELLLAVGRPVQATALLSSLCPTLPKRPKCTKLWMRAAAESSSPEEFTRSVRFAERDGCSSPKACSATYSAIGDVISRTSGPFAALPYYRRAATENPSKAAWMRVAAVAAMIGSHGEATTALDHAASFGTPSPELRESLERERTRAMRSVLKIP